MISEHSLETTSLSPTPKVVPNVWRSHVGKTQTFRSQQRRLTTLPPCLLCGFSDSLTPKFVKSGGPAISRNYDYLGPTRFCHRGGLSQSGILADNGGPAISPHIGKGCLQGMEGHPVVFLHQHGQDAGACSWSGGGIETGLSAGRGGGSQMHPQGRCEGPRTPSGRLPERSGFIFGSSWRAWGNGASAFDMAKTRSSGRLSE